MPSNCPTAGQSSTHPTLLHHSQSSQVPRPPNASSSSSTSHSDTVHHNPKPVQRDSVDDHSKRRVGSPSVTVIEISSDEDEPPTKKMKATVKDRVHDLQTENRNLKAALRSALKASGTRQPAVIPKEDAAAQGRVVAAKKLLSSMKDHITCEICTSTMWTPYTLSCGHTFCDDCLRRWFDAVYAEHVQWRPGYNPQDLISAHHRAQLALPDLPSFLRRDLIRQLIITVGSTTHPRYSCPTCRVLISAKPAENFTIKSIVRTVAGDESNGILDRPPPAPEGPFNKFFPWAQWM